MEAQNHHLQAPAPDQYIEVDADLALGEKTRARKSICDGATCGFSDFSTSSIDSRERSLSMRKLVTAVVLCAIFMSIEIAGGITANSLAILTDAAHMLSDVAAFAISFFSIWAAGWEATPRQSYGFFRIEILGALVSIQLIWLLAGILVFEAITRMMHDSGEVQGYLMFVVSALGLVVNIIMASFLGHDHGHGHSHDGHNHSHDDGDNHRHSCHVKHNQGHTHDAEIGHGHGHDHLKGSHQKDEREALLRHVGCDSVTKGKKKRHRNINVHSAYLHVIGDSIQSIGVMISGAIIWYSPDWKVLDRICTLVFSVIVLATTVKMLRSILDILMESTPREIDAKTVHELHIWAITVGKVLLACHVTISPDADADLVLDMVVDYIRTEYNIIHVTIQIERSTV
ncbi:unnamed protein product [Spirodela intermedia]|uniref:Uncharacterized protein n=1 Tax=Spirodela intermedia TaxID=51605 RepID=A0A7I8IE83_SPIIN|nr:unnamed protein product [Spirodela intermedia]CAA6656096.1 unnamed protein product [Spirodela intermedia]